ERNDRYAGQGEPDLDCRLFGQRGGEYGCQQDGDDTQVTETQRPHAGPLNGGPSSGAQPQADAGLPNASAPDDDERHQRRELQGFWCVSPVYDLKADQAERAQGDGSQHQASGAWCQRNDAVAEEQQGQPGGQEDHDREVGAHSGGARAQQFAHLTEQGYGGQGADRQGQVQ